MPLIAKASLKLSMGNMSNILDLGDFYAAGPLLLRKDLKLSQLSSMFSLCNATGDALSNGGYTNYSPSIGVASPLYLRGSGASVRTEEKALTTTANACYPNMEAMFDDSGSACAYFDSAVGATAGKRLVLVMLGADRPNVSYPNTCFGVVGANGAVQWVTRAYPSDGGGGRVFIFGESSQYLYAYVVCYFVGTSGDCNGSKRRICRVDKGTGALTYISEAAQVTLFGNYVKYCGKTIDNKHWFLCPVSATASAPARSLYWVVVDCSADTITYSANVPAHSLTNNTVGMFTPSAFSDNKLDPTKLKCYAIADPNSAAGALAIKMLTVPASGQTVTANWTPSAVGCSIVGDPGIGVPYTIATLGAWAHQSECWTFDDGDNEYLAVAYHAALDTSSPYYSGNQCPVSKHGIHVFQIDPVDPTKLTYVSSLTNNGFGSTATRPLLLRSVGSKVLVAAGSSGFTPILWNSATQSYVNGQWTPIQLLNIHLDNANQIFVRDYSDNLYVFNVGQSVSIVVEFDTVTAVYTGSDLTVNALVSAYDMMGVRVVQDVQLIVSGGKFSSGGISVMVTTSATADTPVPITVSEAGALTVTPVL